MTVNLEQFKEQWLAVAKSKKLGSTPIARTLLGTPIVLFRDQHKQVVALLDRCPHRNAPLSKGKVKDNCIVCPYHGWQFTDQGDYKSIPGLVRPHGAKIPPIPKFNALEKNGLIWLQLDNTKKAALPYASLYFHDARYHSFIWSVEAQGSIVNVLENFLDGTHTPFVHSGLIRKNAKRQEVTAQVTSTQERVEIRYSGEKKQNGWISKIFEQNRGDSFGRFILPCVAEIEYRTKDHTSFIITAYLTPLSQERQALHAVISFRKRWIPTQLARWILTPFLKKALKQDLEILEWQQKTIKHFGKEHFISTEIDIMRPYIEHLLAGKKQESVTKNVQMQL